jgi:hypothetical protein
MYFVIRSINQGMKNQLTRKRVLLISVFQIVIGESVVVIAAQTAATSRRNVVRS